MNVTLISIDLAKHIYQICGVNELGKTQFNRQIKPRQLLPFLIQSYPGITVAMEACSGSNYLGRTLEENGFTALLIPPRHVKPFVKGNKNDRNDALAIAEAAQRPNMRFVRPKTLTQTDLSMVHRIRERQIASRTQLVNQIRGHLGEYGVDDPKGIDALQRALPFIVEDAENALTPTARTQLHSLYEEWVMLNALIAQHDRTMKAQAKADPTVERVMAIRGVGVTIATATVAHMGEPGQYKNGRQYAACLGLVPKEFSSGGRQKLGGITKRGNRYMRTLLVQGAWSIIRYHQRNDDHLSRWVGKAIVRCGKHKAAVALANKLARILWAVIYHKTDYQPGGI